MICWARSRNPQAGFRFPAHGSTDTGPAGRMNKNFSYTMLPDTITTQSAMVDSMAQSFGLSHKRCDEREPGTTRTARGQQTAQSIKILRRLHVRSCLYPLGIHCRAVQSNVWMNWQWLSDHVRCSPCNCKVSISTSPSSLGAPLRGKQDERMRGWQDSIVSRQRYDGTRCRSLEGCRTVPQRSEHLIASINEAFIPVPFPAKLCPRP